MSEHALDFQHDAPHFRPRPGMVSVHTELPHPLVTALEGLIGKLRWHLDALREWIKRLGMTQKSEEYDPREPPDVERHPFHNRDLAEFVRLAAKLGRNVSNVSGGGPGGKEHWTDYAFKGLVILGIAALVGMTLNSRDKVTRIDTYITEKDKQNEREFSRINRALDRYDERLNSLEHERRDAQPYHKRR